MKIIAIGGGEIGRPGYPVETTEIDKEIIKLSEKKNPRLLFLPTASSDSEGYVNVAREHFGERLGCQVDELLLCNNKVSISEMEEKVLSSDIIYVGGGDTLKMMNTWKRTGVDRIFLEATKKNIILSGVSAGAICWFKYGSSDSIKVSGLNLIPAVLYPHFDIEKNAREDLKELMGKTPGVAIAIDNCCAIEISEEKYRIIDSKSTANAYKAYWKDGKYYEVKILKEEYLPIARLLEK